MVSLPAYQLPTLVVKDEDEDSLGRGLRLRNKINMSWKALSGHTEANTHLDRFPDHTECGQHKDDDFNHLVNPSSIRRSDGQLPWALKLSFPLLAPEAPPPPPCSFSPGHED